MNQTAAAGTGQEARVMRDIAGKLRARGLSVTECVSVDELIELVITNPADPGSGWVHVGYEGYLVWEHWARADLGSAAEEVIAAVTGILNRAGSLDDPGVPAGDAVGRPGGLAGLVAE